MGYLNASGMANQLPLKDAIRWHLSSNCYPPQPESLVEACVQAVRACVDCDADDPTNADPNEIDLGDISHKRYGNKIPANVLVNELQLQAFVDHERNKSNALDDFDYLPDDLFSGHPEETDDASSTS